MLKISHCQKRREISAERRDDKGEGGGDVLWGWTLMVRRENGCVVREYEWEWERHDVTIRPELGSKVGCWEGK